MTSAHDVLILGGGLAGLSAAWELGRRACVLEREARPGGLVRSERVDGYWFDHVIHLLHLSDPVSERRLRGLLGDVLARCPPRAFVECAAGTTRFPLQDHLAGLDPAAVVRCLTDLAQVTYAPSPAPPNSYAEMLRQSFGAGLCELFFEPYNRKMWRRPLEGLAPSGFQWNISRPDFAGVLRGALDPAHHAAAYNANGWYPRPPRGAPLRGMEVLSQRLAAQAADLRCGHEVLSLDPARRRVRARHQGEVTEHSWRAACLSTLPLPRALALCAGAPAELVDASRAMTRNRVRSVMLCVRGPRPEASGHWRYYADESLAFTRLVFMTEFDPDAAPPEGFGVLAEVTEPAEQPPEPDDALARRVIDDVRRVGWLAPPCEVVARRCVTVDPAYVVFTPDNRAVVEAARAFLRGHGVEPLGRYGRWEYSSMEQVIRDGLQAGAGVPELAHGGADA